MTAEEHLAEVKRMALELLESDLNPGLALMKFAMHLIEHPHFTGNHPCFSRGGMLLREGHLHTKEEALAYIESVQVDEEPPDSFLGAPGPGEPVTLTMIRDLRLGVSIEGIVLLQMNVKGEVLTYGLTDDQVGMLFSGLPEVLSQRITDGHQQKKRVFNWDA